ncbi:unnamed protein product [Cladocopium goreaui]|uniref:Copia protein n=1 Tax=Cladocopium goreaui TaxID=2562237 RepID=A0A9P1DU75_9DINO|nr:unnamed protein product [Cladocopium goreaui]
MGHARLEYLDPRWPGSHRSVSSFEELPALKAHVDELRKAIDSMNTEWARGRDAMERNYDKVHSLKEDLDSNWKARHDALEAACTRLRDSLDKVGEDRTLCSEAQSSSTEGLPALFLKRFKDPMRFTKFQEGKIHGCTPKFDNDECLCPTGHEELGCQDATDSSSFELKCSNILNMQIPSSNVLDFFKSRGACNMSNHDELLKQVVDQETMHRLETSSIGAVGAVGAVLPMALCGFADRGRSRTKAARDFLCSGAT